MNLESVICCSKTKGRGDGFPALIYVSVSLVLGLSCPRSTPRTDHKGRASPVPTRRTLGLRGRRPALPAQTCSTSPSRATIWYRTGLTMRPRNSRETRPATMTMAKGRCESDPMPCEKRGGQQAQAGHQRRHHDGPQAHHRSLEGRFADVLPFQPQFVDVGSIDDGGFHRHTHQHQQSQDGRDAERRVGQLERQQRSHGFGQHHAQHDDDGKLEIAVEREEDQEDQQDGDGADHA